MIADGHVYIPFSPNEPRINHAGAPPLVYFRYLPQQNQRQSPILIVHVRRGRASRFYRSDRFSSTLPAKPHSKGSFFDRVTAKISSLGLEASAISSSERRNSFRKPPVRTSSVDSIGGQQPCEAESAPIGPGSKSRSRSTIIPELAALMVYTAGVRYQGFSKLVEYKTTEMFSVSEKVANKLLRSAPADFIKHNRTHLSRVYPQGTRLSSSNYLPHQYWAMGCQLVSLNWQTYGMTSLC